MSTATATRLRAPNPQGSLRSEDLAEIERQLTRELSRAQRAAQSLRQEATRDRSVNDGGDIMDRTSSQADRERAGEFATRSQQNLREIETALQRLHASPESFNVCQGCGGRIPIGRLEFLPTTRYCMPCSA